jgi:hypothetical protein
MTTYGFTVSLDEQEVAAIKEAIEFYLTDEAKELRKKSPKLVRFFAEIKLSEILATKKLYENAEFLSSNTFFKPK